MSSKRLNILVVGAGPSGLILTLLLAKYGLNVQLIDKGSSLDESPRASHYAPPAVRYLHLAGVGAAAAAQGFAPTDMTWRKLDGSLIATLQLYQNADDPNQLICLPLDMLGRLLYEQVQKEPLAEVSWGCEVVDLGQDEERAWVEVEMEEEKGDGKRERKRKRLEADYVVGCDGAGSKVRRCLFGSEFPGKTWEVQIVATNVYYDLHSFGYADINTIIDAEHFNMCARLNRDGLWRVSYGEKTGFTDEELVARQPMKYETLLPGHPKPGEYRITNISPYKMHQRVADSMHKGRFLLAADAAHLCTPFGGLGLSGGIVDVGNLADCLLAIQLLPSTSSTNPNSTSSTPSAQDILAAYSQIRRQKWLEVTNPISSSNLERLITCDPDKAVEQDEFLGLLKKGESDSGIMKEILRGAYELDYDFEGRWAREIQGLGEGWRGKAMRREEERVKGRDGEREGGG